MLGYSKIITKSTNTSLRAKCTGPRAFTLLRSLAVMLGMCVFVVKSAHSTQDRLAPGTWCVYKNRVVTVAAPLDVMDEAIKYFITFKNGEHKADAVKRSELTPLILPGTLCAFSSGYGKPFIHRVVTVKSPIVNAKGVVKYSIIFGNKKEDKGVEESCLTPIPLNEVENYYTYAHNFPEGAKVVYRGAVATVVYHNLYNNGSGWSYMYRFSLKLGDGKTKDVAPKALTLPASCVFSGCRGLCKINIYADTEENLEPLKKKEIRRLEARHDKGLCKNSCYKQII